MPKGFFGHALPRSENYVYRSELVSLLVGTYVRIATADTITAVHTFSPGAPGVPFILAANAQGQKVVGLNADQLDGLSSAAFLILAGQAGGQSANGGTGASENLTWSSTAHATKGKILFGTSGYDESNNRFGIRTASPSAALHVVGSTTSAVDQILFQNSTPSTILRGLGTREVIIPISLKVGSDNSPSIPFEVDGNAILGGSHNNGATTGLLVSSNGSTSVQIVGRSRNAATNRPVSIGITGGTLVATGLGVAAPDTNSVVEVGPKSYTSSGGFTSAAVLKLLQASDANTNTNPFRNMAARIEATSSRASGSAALTNVALQLRAANGQINYALAIGVIGSDSLIIDSTGDIIKLKSLSYVWPSAQGNASLLNDGSGNLTWGGPATDVSQNFAHELLLGGM